MISVSIPHLSTFYLILMRLSLVILFSPFEVLRQLPLFIRLSLLFVLAYLLLPYVPLVSYKEDSALVLAALAEVSNSLVFVLSFQAAFAVFHLAGQLIDNQMGLNAMIFNPSLQSQSALTGYLLSILGLLFFFAVNGHHGLFLSILESFNLIKPGFSSLLEGFKPLTKLFGLMFSFGILLASPVVLGLLFVDTVSLILARSMPQVSTYFLTLPFKILLGCLLLHWTIDSLSSLMTKLFDSTFQTLRTIVL